MRSEASEIQKLDALASLAEEINDYHAKCEEAIGQAVSYAMEAGDRLTKVKESLAHGEWLPWLEKNFKGTPRTAQAYMRVANNRAELEKRSGASHLSLRGALKEIGEGGKTEAPNGKPYCTTMVPNGAGGWDQKHYYTIEEYAATHGYRISPPLLVDAEFDGLLPPLADDEYAGLERSIRAEGCRDAIVAWNNTILDGHARYEICVKHGIDYLVADKEMEDRNDAMLYIIREQLGRKNLSDIEKIHMQVKWEVDRLVRERGISEAEAWEELVGSEDGA